ncbi:MAG: hypothetical protein KAJ67_06935, partial [Gemmatimonadetes bacterium]|nr:hypothetical protein [Gemmatimonadota bacterium]
MSRRDWLKLGGVGVAGLSGTSVLALARRGGAAAALEHAGVQEVIHSPTELAQLRMGVFGDHAPA